MRKRQQRKTYKEEKKPEASGETSYRIEVKDPKWKTMDTVEKC